MPDPQPTPTPQGLPPEGPLTHEQVTGELKEVMSNEKHPHYQGYKRGDPTASKYVGGLYDRIAGAKDKVEVGAVVPGEGMTLGGERPINEPTEQVGGDGQPPMTKDAATAYVSEVGGDPATFVESINALPEEQRTHVGAIMSTIGERAAIKLGVSLIKATQKKGK